MTEQEIHYLSSNGSTQIQAFLWKPDGEPIGILQISHGMCEYIERYRDFASYLCGKGYLVCGNNHLGHGDSLIDETFGYFGDKNGHKYLIDDVHGLTVQMKKQFPNLPYFLLGHSMGSFIARLVAAQYYRDYTGALFCGTNGGNPFAGFGMLLADIISLVYGKRHPSKLLNNLSTGAFERKMGIGWLSTDLDQLAKYQNDEKCGFLFTASAYHELFCMIRKISKKEWAESFPNNFPVYLFSGEEDPVGAMGRGVTRVYQRLLAAGKIDVSIKLYPGGRHEMLNERNREEVYEDVWNWISERMHR
jgi:alpha-beta hydrolase superfamily lysophospholipase